MSPFPRVRAIWARVPRPRSTPRPLLADFGSEAPEPGEVVWAWVPYEEDPTRGKDRPVLVIGLEADGVLALQMTSKDHDRDAEQEASVGRFWMDIGTGSWDSERRPSEVRLNRLLRLSTDSIRRDGGKISADLLAEVLAATRPYLD